MKVLVTGAAGFIGMHVAQRLLDLGATVVGLDNLNAYYDPALKEARLARLRTHQGFSFERVDVADRAAVATVFADGRFERVVHLAAQAGVRHSLKAPHEYVDSNLTGFVNILEGCRHTGVGHLLYASSSSVYGDNGLTPFSEHHAVDHPISLYAATKRANELMAHTYSHLFGLPTTGLRFFTVYGPWGRPDMAAFLFVDAILEGRPIEVFNFGRMQRDFTFIDDIVEGVVRMVDRPPMPASAVRTAGAASSGETAPHRVLNIGRGVPVRLLDFIEAIETEVGRTADRRMVPMQEGDVSVTYADTTALREACGYEPVVDVAEGVRRFVAWYRDFYQR